MMTRREFVRNSVAVAGGAALFSGPFASWGGAKTAGKSRVVSVAAEDMLLEMNYNPDAVHRAFSAGLKELTGERTLGNAWTSLVSPDDVVGIKINGIGAPRISSSLASINETIAGLKTAGVKENNIIIWDRMDRDFQRTGLQINRGPGSEDHGGFSRLGGRHALGSRV